MMSKTSLILSREYLTRVRKKSFIVMSIIGPLLFAALLVLPAWFAQLEDKELKTVAVIDSSKVFLNAIPETDYIKFRYLNEISLESAREQFNNMQYYAVLYIPHIVHYSPESVMLYSTEETSFSVQNHIVNSLEKEIEKQKLKANGIDENILQSVKTNIDLKTIKWTKDGKEKETNMVLRAGVGYASGFLIYIFVLFFGSQVMRGVIEEKTGRIIEIIVSSVRPFQLMLGKIIGIALVGLTQFALWVFLTLGIVTVANSILFQEDKQVLPKENVTKDILSSEVATENNIPQDDKAIELKGVLSSLKYINYGVVLGSFIFFFLGGYLLYASFFAAIGSAVDNETDTQQFMFPITIPLVIAIFVLINTIQNPGSELAFWFSMIPFTSPVVMMARIPFGVPYWEVIISMALLVLTFLGTTWMAGKIYRTGILMYGKKVNYKELWKWLNYKN